MGGGGRRRRRRRATTTNNNNNNKGGSPFNIGWDSDVTEPELGMLKVTTVLCRMNKEGKAFTTFHALVVSITKTREKVKHSQRSMLSLFP